MEKKAPLKLTSRCFLCGKELSLEEKGKTWLVDPQALKAFCKSHEGGQEKVREKALKDGLRDLRSMYPWTRR